MKMKKEKYYYYDSKLLTKRAKNLWNEFNIEMMELGIEHKTWLELVDDHIMIFSERELNGETVTKVQSDFYSLFNDYLKEHSNSIK